MWVTEFSFVPVLVKVNGHVKLSICIPSECMGECSHSSTHSWRWHRVEMSGQIHPGCLSPGESPRNTLDRRLGCLQSRSGGFGEQKNRLPLPEKEPCLLSCATWSTVTIPTTLSRLVFDKKSPVVEIYFIITVRILYLVLGLNVITDESLGVSK